MDVKTANATFAYAEALTHAAGLGPGPGPAQSPDGASFAEILNGVAGDAVTAVSGGETASARALGGEADIVDVVTAVANAEITLQTVVALRDRVVQAYQEILRMPI